ncbi:MFS transporter [Pontibacillus marinus]|uniref:MFS transporter n=1 Tax=Pontibacillus marinus TaxID=273164 RepID=UPI000687CD18|nr:MFS transporter [Pontibacillus marinus]
MKLYIFLVGDDLNGWISKYVLLLSGVGISYLGNWIYLIAINITILNLTGSAAAVAGLYIIKPIALLITNFWSGSVIDRVNKRKLMIIVDIVRGILVFCIPFVGFLWGIYGLIFLINIVGAFFGPSSAVYITKLIPPERRQRFNSMMSMTNSGAFLLGPAISGILIMYVGTELCIIINAFSFIVCAFFIFLLPDVDEETGEVREPIKWKTLLKDLKAVVDFSKRATFFITVYLLFQIAMLIGFALDSQEVTFIKQNLELSERDYGLIVSITGIGALLGGSVAAVLSKKIQLRFYIGGGILLSSVGYVMFYSSFNFISATFAFVFLGFFMAFANTGYATFFQNSIPVDLMGRFGSIANMVQGLIQIGFTLLLGLTSEWFSLQIVCLIFASVGTLIAAILFSIFLFSEKAKFDKEQSNAFTS